jgi:hypothetical protein
LKLHAFLSIATHNESGYKESSTGEIVMLVDVHFKWKLIGGDIHEMSFNGYPSIGSAQDSFEDFWGITIADCEYLEREVLASHEIPEGECYDS